MTLGITQDSTGLDVAQLHRILVFSGQAIGPDELARATFGLSAFAALRALQAPRGLGVTGVVDRETLGVLLEIERSMAGTVGNEPPHPPLPSPPPGDTEATVKGTLIDHDGNVIAAARIVVFQPRLRVLPQPLPGAEATTDAHGSYTIAYDRPAAASLLVRAFDQRGRQLAESYFDAAPEITVDLTTATEGVVRSPSQFSQRKSRALSILDDVTLSSLVENKDTHEVRFLADAGLRDDTLFGLLSAHKAHPPRRLP